MLTMSCLVREGRFVHPQMPRRSPPCFRMYLLLVSLSISSVDCLNRVPVQQSELENTANWPFSRLLTPSAQKHSQTMLSRASPHRSNATWKESTLKERLRLVFRREDFLNEEGEPAWPPVVVAFVLTLISGLTLPLGAIIGVVVTPAEDCEDAEEKMEKVHSVSSGFLAFGAGSLLFAVTVELYGSALISMEEAEKQANGISWLPVQVMATTNISSVVGALVYIWANRKLKDSLEQETAYDSGEESVCEKIVPSTRNLAGKVMERRMDKKRQQDASVALSIFLGVLIDGLPEGIMLGFLAADGRLSLALIVSLLVANFPEALSAGILLRKARRSVLYIVSLWSFLCLLTAVLAAVSCFLCPRPDNARLAPDMAFLSGFIEGLAAGAMLSCIAAVMIPEAFHLHGDIAGFLLVFGFVVAVTTKVSGVLIASRVPAIGPQEIPEFD
eukprot:TRINITY_DN47594_c0_g1_i1.p1 TRINITY_DN47594_c0_g1~~TRINITY_DN47594_c0_g1_i1.p1  ORF type:complete len:444 (-),score=61.37 TRINITY_DN47594_c0_g1_i1:334-1665(-)